MYIAGIDPTFSQTSAEASSQGVKFGAGQLGYNSTSQGPKGYIWAKAGAAITGDGYVCILTATPTGGWVANMITTTNAGGGTGAGKLIGVCRSTVAGGLTTDSYGWFQVYGQGTVRVAASAAAYTQLYTTATAGVLNTTSTAGITRGIVINTANGGSEANVQGVINNPITTTA